jgi:hypothetical protein
MLAKLGLYSKLTMVYIMSDRSYEHTHKVYCLEIVSNLYPCENPVEELAQLASMCEIMVWHSFVPSRDLSEEALNGLLGGFEEINKPQRNKNTRTHFHELSPVQILDRKTYVFKQLYVKFPCKVKFIKRVLISLILQLFDKLSLKTNDGRLIKSIHKIRGHKVILVYFQFFKLFLEKGVERKTVYLNCMGFFNEEIH